jgi:hypothetical protein
MREITEFHVHTAEGIHDGVLQCLEPATLFTLGTFVKTKKEKFFIFAEQFFSLRNVSHKRMKVRRVLKQTPGRSGRPSLFPLCTI